MIELKLKSVFYTFLILISPLFSNAQWQQVSGLDGDRIYSIRSNSIRTFALTQSGLFRTDNNGSTWTFIPQTLFPTPAERLAISNDTVICISQIDNYISTNNGNNWTALNPPSLSIFASDVACGGGKIFMSTYGDYLYSTTNGGSTWSQVSQGLTTNLITCLAVEGSVVFAGSDNGIFKSSNGGTSFTASGLGGDFIFKVYSKGTDVIAYTATGIHKSSDNGSTWSAFQAPSIFYSDITDFAIAGSKVFAATDVGVISSLLAAPIWQLTNTGFTYEQSKSVCSFGSNVFIGSNRGVMRSVNSGTAWTSNNTGITTSAITGITVTPGDTIYAGSSVYGVSQYDGTNWAFSGVPLLNSNSIVYDVSGIFTCSDNGIHRSVDNGVTWDLISNSIANPIITYCVDVAVADTLIIGAALQFGVLRSGDNGLNWALVDAGLQGTQTSCITVSGNNIIAGTYNNGIYTSADGGLTWNQTGAPGSGIYDVAALGNVVFAASGGVNYRSTDGGLSWTSAGSGFYDKLSVAGNYLVGSSDSYIELSLDSGLTFSYNIPGPAGTFIISNKVSDDYVYIGTAFDGVWKISLFFITGIDNQSINEFNEALIQPNLFRNETYLIVDENILSKNPQLQVYDSRGRSVLNSSITSSKTKLEASNLSKGVYFYRVVMNNNSSTKVNKFVIH